MYGDQTPRILVSRPSLSSAGQEVVELAEHFGVILDPWQCLVLDEGLKEGGDNKWAAFEVGLMVSRQSGKGKILEALELAGLFLFGEQLIQHSAHQFRTSKEAMRRLEYLLSQSNEKYKANRSHGEESIELMGGPNRGARVMFQTRTKAGGLGLTGDRVIFDEAMIISSEALQALMPTLSARPNPQIWYTGSAVDQRIHAHCDVFGGVRQRALSGDPGRLCYMEWSCEPGADPTSLRERARANPGQGYRITPEYIEDEYRSFSGTGDVRAFGVQRLGIGDWPLLGDARTEIPAKKWNAMHTPEREHAGRPVVALCRAPEGGPWSVVGAQRLTDGRIHLEVGYCGDDTADEVMRRVVDVVTAWNPMGLVIGRHVDALTELETAGIDVTVPTRTEEAQACGGFLNDVLTDVDPPLLSHANQGGLNNATKQAVRRELSAGGFVWKTVDGRAYAQLMGVTLARWGLVKFGGESKPEPTVHEWPADIQSWLEEDDEEIHLEDEEEEVDLDEWRREAETPPAWGFS
jgi:hypothetical protein